MILTVFGATGQAGKRIVKYALAKGHTVCAFGRNVTDLIDKDNDSDKLKAIQGSVFDAEEVYNALKGSDAVLSALGGAFDDENKTRSLGIKTIIAQMQKAGIKKITALGGMGILNAPDDTMIMDSSAFPPEYFSVSKEHLNVYRQLEKSNLDWTFVCAPTIKDEDASGKYSTAVTYFPDTNNYFITAGDIAHFMITEAESQEHNKQRIGISG